jgi:hypothetical protein
VRLTSGSRKRGGRARCFEEDDAKYLGKVSCRSLSLRGTKRSNDAARDEKGVADLLMGLLCQPWKGVLLCKDAVLHHKFAGGGNSVRDTLLASNLFYDNAGSEMYTSMSTANELLDAL